jgi:hypothetical protein
MRKTIPKITPTRSFVDKPSIMPSPVRSPD